MTMPLDTPHHRSGAQRAIDWLFRDEATGKLVIAQVPNLPLAVFLVATGVRMALQPTGTAGAVVSVVGAVSLTWWAVLEIARGDSRFRRLLGAVVLASVAVGLLTR